MKTPRHQGPIDVLAQVYEKLFESVVKNFHNTEEKSGALLHKLIDEAKEEAVKLGEISREDAEKLSNYLRRDLSDAARYLSETGRDLREWLGFETILLETEILDQLLNIADPTTVELFKLKLDSRETPAWHTGEITGPGTLVCDQCGEKLHFYKAGKIPPCPKCHATSYHRKIET